MAGRAHGSMYSPKEDIVNLPASVGCELVKSGKAVEIVPNINGHALKCHGSTDKSWSGGRYVYVYSTITTNSAGPVAQLG